MNAEGYTWFDEIGCRWAMYFLVAIGQLCVVPFLFFSGYGITERVKASGMDYVNGMPKKRVWPFYLNSLPVAVAWVIYGAFIPSIVYPYDALSQLTFWRGIDFGPCWYNFCIIVLYLTTFVAFKVVRGKNAPRWSECIVWLLSLGYVLGMAWVRPEEPWWFDTALAYPFGVTFSLHREQLIPLMRKTFWPLLLLTFAAIVGFKMLPRHDLMHNVYGMCFMVFLLAIMLKVRFGNPVLNWIGARAFPIYMYHLLFYRLWRFCFAQPLTGGGAHVIFFASFVCTGLVAWAYPILAFKASK